MSENTVKLILTYTIQNVARSNLLNVLTGIKNLDMITAANKL